MRPQHRPVFTVEALPVPADRHIGVIIYVLATRAFYAGYRDSAGLPQWAPLAAPSGRRPSL